MVTVPAFLPVTLPPETVAMPVLLLDQVIVLFVALVGLTVAVRVTEAFLLIVALVLFRVTDVTATVAAAFFTVIVAVALLPPAFAVILTVPTFSLSYLGLHLYLYT